MKNTMEEQSLILLVDDTANDLQILGNILHDKKYKIAAVKSGKEALEFIGKKNPNLILLDILMPDMDGFEVCQKIKENEAFRHIPVIFISALREKKNVLQGFEYGAVDYITKPFNKEEVLARVKAHITIYNQKNELDALNEELIGINRTKDKFFSIIAHDLKNPLGAFKNVTGFLLKNFRELDDNEKMEFLNLLNSSAQNVYSLLENLLYWSNSQRGMIEYNPEDNDLSFIAEDSIKLLAMNAEKKSIKLESAIKEKSYVYADANMVSTIIRNLLSNAIKFTPEGGNVKISAKKKDKFYEITISDDGVGIPKDTLKKIFLLDVHISTKGTSREEGTGLGLVLCQEFVRKNGGDIRVESEEGVGSRFIFTLPVSKM